jgi:Mg2+ and Co2+ transporter CorA
MLIPKYKVMPANADLRKGVRRFTSLCQGLKDERQQLESDVAKATQYADQLVRQVAEAQGSVATLRTALGEEKQPRPPPYETLHAARREARQRLIQMGEDHRRAAREIIDALPQVNAG